MTHNGKNTWHERFYLYRQTDVTGYSGTGVIAEGVRFEDGACAVRWCVPDKPKSTVVYESIVDVMAIHGHDGATTVMWLDTTDEPEDVKVSVCRVDETVGQGDPETVHGTAEAKLGALV